MPTFKENIEQIMQVTLAKAMNGFDVSLSDVFALILGKLYLGKEYLNQTLSGLITTPSFTTHSVAYPIINITEEVGVADEYSFAQWEWTPFTTGVWEYSSRFISTKYVGTSFVDGKVEDTTDCIERFDTMSFVGSMQGSAFAAPFLGSQFYTDLCGTPESPNATNARDCQLIINSMNVAGFNSNRMKNSNESALPLFPSLPNPLFLSDYPTKETGKWKNVFEKSRLTSTIKLNDAGFRANIPVTSMQGQRGVQVMFLVDSSPAYSYDPYNQATGEELLKSARLAKEQGVPFPTLPADHAKYLKGKGIQFFGCNEDTPLAVYIPTDVSADPTLILPQTMDFSFTDAERERIAKNGYDSILRNPRYSDINMGDCLSCAVWSRGLKADNTYVKDDKSLFSSECQTCFTKLCYNKKDENDTEVIGTTWEEWRNSA